MRNFILTVDQIGVWVALACGLATLFVGLVALVTQTPSMLDGHLGDWLVALPEIGAGLVCTLWCRGQLAR